MFPLWRIGSLVSKSNDVELNNTKANEPKRPRRPRSPPRPPPPRPKPPPPSRPKQLMIFLVLIKVLLKSLRNRTKDCTFYILVNGGWGEWTRWGDCSAPCEGGTKNRTRRCNNPTPKYNGKHCNADGSSDTQTKQCNTFRCLGKIICCNILQVQTRAILYDILNFQIEKILYLAYSVLLVNGGWGEWSSWTECPVNCGSGHRNRTRLCDNPVPQIGGYDCTGYKKYDREIQMDIEELLCDQNACECNVKKIIPNYIKDRTKS